MVALISFAVPFVGPAAANEADIEIAKSLLDATLNCPVPPYMNDYDKVLDQNTYAGGGDQFLNVGIWRRHADGYPPRVWGEMLMAKAEYGSLATPKVSEDIVILECFPWKPRCLDVSVKRDGEIEETKLSYSSFSIRICDRDTAGNFATAVQTLTAAAVAHSVQAATPTAVASPAPVATSAPVAAAPAKASNTKSEDLEEQLLFDPNSIGEHD
jgi:hypothetical protein